jgi:hypothetical protein
MGLLAFIASIASSLAWPAVVLFLLFLLRPHLRGLTARLEELTLPGGTKAKFVTQLEAAREQSENIVLAEGEPLPQIGTAGVEQYLELANTSPEAAIMQAYKTLESIAITFQNKIPRRDRNNLARIILDLHRRERLESSWVELFEKIRRLRNLAVHAGAAQPITPGEAIEYASMCRLLSDKLYEIFGQLPEVEQNTEQRARL